MGDADCTAFLQRALPRLELRWAGFRKVRTQVCKRLKARIRDLGLDGFPAYGNLLDADPSEWRFLDECCHITISRFFRDRRVFDVLRECVLPAIAAQARREDRDARIWSAGCASGEEPYTLKILWDADIASRYPDVRISIVASDIDKVMLDRAREGCFGPSSLRELPQPLIEQAFDSHGPQFCIRPRLREGVEFLEQDLRTAMPGESFDLVLCRYLAFTYFSAPLQQKVLTGIAASLRPAGYLVIGTHERLPVDHPQLAEAFGLPQLFRKKAMDQRGGGG